MDSIDIHGVHLEFTRLKGRSDGPTLVFLHEGLGSVSMWSHKGVSWPQALCEATGLAGLVYSRRGYGRSGPVADVRGPSRSEAFWHIGRHEPDYMHREAWDVLPLLLERLAVSRPILVGHSDGATIALLHASRHPVSACVVMAPHVFVEDIAVQAIDQARQAFLHDPDAPGSLRQRLTRYHRDVDNAFWQWNDVWLSSAFRDFNIESDCARIEAPLLVLQGEDDAYGTLDQVHAIARRVPHAHTQTWPACGHSPHRDVPVALTATIHAFLQQHQTAL